MLVNCSESQGAQFKRQLEELCATIRAASPHYIRCLNPNSYKLPQKVDGANVLLQLRAAGLVEAVRVARQGEGKP